MSCSNTVLFKLPYIEYMNEAFRCFMEKGQIFLAILTSTLIVGCESDRLIAVLTLADCGGEVVEDILEAVSRNDPSDVIKEKAKERLIWIRC